jgi:broad specificity phosphatase PhoE
MSTALSAEECSKIIAAKLKIKVADVVDSAESATELSQRQHLFFHKVFDELCQEDSTNSTSILCVSHSAFIRGLLSSNLGIDIKAISNCSITKLLISRDVAGSLTFSCLPEEVNDAAHMQQEEQPK